MLAQKIDAVYNQNNKQIVGAEDKEKNGGISNRGEYGIY